MQSDRPSHGFDSACIAAIQCTIPPACLDDKQHRLNLVNVAISALEPMIPGFKATIRGIMARVLIANCLMTMQESAAAFIYLRQAISLFEIFRVHEPGPSFRFSPSEGLRLHRIHWLLFIHEKYQAVSEFREPILKPLRTMPEFDEQMSREAHVGFTRIVKLFCFPDDDFLALWLENSTTNTGADADATWVQRKGAELKHDSEAARNENRILDATQQADLSITRCWLLTLLWRVAMKHDLLSNLPPDMCLSVFFPIDITGQLRQSLQTLPIESIMSHGVGVTQKLFEVADIAADLLLYAHPSLSSRGDELFGSLDYLHKLIIDSQLDDTRRSVLVEKSNRIQQWRTDPEMTAEHSLARWPRLHQDLPPAF